MKLIVTVFLSLFTLALVSGCQSFHHKHGGDHSCCCSDHKDGKENQCSMKEKKDGGKAKDAKKTDQTEQKSQ